MIYLDNAATTKQKPREVYNAFQFYMEEIGVSPGRGSYKLGIEASRMLYNARKATGDYFGLQEKANVIFTKNSTEAINLLVNSLLREGGHVVITCYEHNAVLRPVHALKERGMVDYSVIEYDDLDKSPELIFEKYANKNTKVFISTLASNLTGRIVFKEDLTSCFKKNGVVTFVDASQGAGKIKINMQAQNIDFLAFTGHKDIMALPGVGGLCCGEKDIIKPLIQGGTGIHGDSYVNPAVFPEGLEAGTLNMPAIWAWKKALEYNCKHFEENIEKEKRLINYLIKGLEKINNIVIYDKTNNRVGTVGFNIIDKSANEVVELFDKDNICVRGGIHCTILAHEALGTTKQGVVRISTSIFNTKDEIDIVLGVLRNISKL